MSGVINDLKQTLGMGARANKYKVIINGKSGVGGQIIDVLCKNTVVPGRSFNDIEVWNQGRLTVVAGEASFDGTWAVTFMDTERHTLRGKFIAWMEYIDSAVNHSRGTVSHTDYMGTAELQQLSTKDNRPTAKYLLEDIYPKSISESTLSDESQEILEFTVEFNYTTWAKIGVPLPVDDN